MKPLLLSQGINHIGGVVFPGTLIPMGREITGNNALESKTLSFFTFCAKWNLPIVSLSPDTCPMKRSSFYPVGSPRHSKLKDVINSQGHKGPETRISTQWIHALCLCREHSGSLLKHLLSWGRREHIFFLLLCVIITFLCLKISQSWSLY